MIRSQKKPRIALVENFAKDFFSARMELYYFLEHYGFDVTAVFPDDSLVENELKNKINFITYNFSRNSKNPLKIINNFFSLYNIFKTHKFDIVHTFRFHPNLYGNIICLLSGHKKNINHVTGLGLSFSKTGLLAFISKSIYSAILQFNILVCSYIIVQNPDDLKFLQRFIFSKKKIKLIKGSGVNISLFNPEKINQSRINVLKNSLNIHDDSLKLIFISRLLKEKGICELIDSVTSIYEDGHNISLLVVGWIDQNNPSSIKNGFIKKYDESKFIRFLGRRDDIKELLFLSDIYVLPSYYREGIPRSNLEALAMKKPIITTDMPGCNLTVTDGENGFLVKPKNNNDLKTAIMYFINNPKEIIPFGEKSRSLVENAFSSEIINSKLINLYKNLLNG